MGKPGAPGAVVAEVMLAHDQTIPPGLAQLRAGAAPPPSTVISHAYRVGAEQRRVFLAGLAVVLVVGSLS